LAGFVYVDSKRTGIKLPTDRGIGGVTLTLTGVDDLGNSILAVQTTASDGSYDFTSLRPGTYTITETHPAGYVDEIDTIGTPGGTTAQNQFSNIVLPVGFSGVNNNFGEIPVRVPPPPLG